MKKVLYTTIHQFISSKTLGTSRMESITLTKKVMTRESLQYQILESFGPGVICQIYITPLSEANIIKGSW